MAEMSSVPLPADDQDVQVLALLAQVGDRVRAQRNDCGLSRRVLSEKSGVSPRYLAQLEAGQGNISIALLKRVALALETSVTALLADEDEGNLLEHFVHADPQTQTSVRQMLGLQDQMDGRVQRICLVGLRGAGKSTLGRRAANALGLPFLELNEEIARDGGMPIAEVMALYGMEGYRKLEAAALDRVISNHRRVILAVAGGIVAEPQTYDRLLGQFHTIWLKAAPQEHMERVRAQGDERPMANNPDAMQQLRSILTSREAAYARAEAHLDTAGCTEDTSLSALISLISDRGFLD